MLSNGRTTTAPSAVNKAVSRSRRPTQQSLRESKYRLNDLFPTEGSLIALSTLLQLLVALYSRLCSGGPTTVQVKHANVFRSRAPASAMPCGWNRPRLGYVHRDEARDIRMQARLRPH